MLFAKVVLGLAVSGPFDYIVGENLRDAIKPGCRVNVNFRNKQETAYVVSIEKESSIPKLKEITSLIDTIPVLDEDLLRLTKEISDYYGCTWGEAIATALPEPIRRGKRLNITREIPNQDNPLPAQRILLYDRKGDARWDFYLQSISRAIATGGSAIIIVPDVSYIFKIKPLLDQKLSISSTCLYRKQPQAAEIWSALKEGRSKVVIGTRSAIFAPLPNTRLIIVDEEHDFVYKQDQVPHYHCRTVALMRAQNLGSSLILGSGAPSLESMHMVRSGTLELHELAGPEAVPHTKIIDMNTFLSMTKYKNVILSRYLEDTIASTINTRGSVLLFLNRKGFATKASCQNCQKTLQCPSCETNLVYYFATNTLECTHCTHKIPAPHLCPSCNTGYIKYSGLGTGKIESELSRIFPQARIKVVDSHHDIDTYDADLYVSTSFIINAVQAIPQKQRLSFDLVATLNIDSSLNRHDFRATENTFAILTELRNIAKKSLVIQTKIPEHYCFTSIANNTPNIFFNEELSQRKQLDLPPYTHLCHIKVRGKQSQRVQKIAEDLLRTLSEANTNPHISFFASLPAHPPKLRGNYYWIVHAKTGSCVALTQFLKKQLRELKYSGIIITVDMDPN